MNLHSSSRDVPGVHELGIRTKLYVTLIGMGTLPTVILMAFGPIPVWIRIIPLIIIVLLAVLIVRWLMEPFEDLQERLGRARFGDYSGLTQSGINDEIGQIATTLDASILQAKALIDEAKNERLELENDIMAFCLELSDAVNGDLTVSFAKHNGALGSVSRAVSTLLERYVQVASRAKETVGVLDLSTKQAVDMTTHLSIGTQSQLDYVTDIKMTLSTVATIAAAVKNRSLEASMSSNIARERAAHGARLVTDAHDVMSSIRDATQRATRHVKSLGESAQLIRQALTLVQRNTEDLHIVAGNASIEAARYADRGGIFRGVADSIEALAEQSQLALSQIQDVVERNHRETMGVVEAIEEVTTQVSAGTKVVHGASGAFSAVSGVIDELAEHAEVAAKDSISQDEYIRTVTGLIDALCTACEETSQSTKTAQASLGNLRELSSGLRDTVSALRVA